MSHIAGHIIITSVRGPVSLALGKTDQEVRAHPPAPSRVLVWHLVLGLPLLGFIAGAWIF
jgi:hypothetical protein